MGRVGRLGVVGFLVLVVVVVGAAPALACSGLVGPGGTVQLARTTTLAAYHGGIEHYVTAFKYQGGGAKFGSIIPLPGIPAKVEKGGDWTLNRLIRETQPVFEARALTAASGSAPDLAAEELLKTKVDALDITVLRGGGMAVGTWARQHGFGLSPDAPEVLDFYAARSPIFMAASFDPTRAERRGQRLGDGTSVHLTIPTPSPWVPLRILGLGLKPADTVEADVFLLTDRKPAMLPKPGRGVRLEQSRPASASLLADLRSDRGMGWLPASDMWLSYLRVQTTAGALKHDLAVDATGQGTPSLVAAGLAVGHTGTGGAGTLPSTATGTFPIPRFALALLATAAVALLALALRRVARR
jgi:hypothetical protein